MAHYQILIVEDDPGVVSLLAQALGEEGFSVQAVESAKAARRELSKSEFDLIVLDRTLPDGDGLELCAEFRKKPAKDSVPILFLTARDSTDDKIEGLRSGGDDYITKPFNTAELLARVEALLRRSGRMGSPDSITVGNLKMDIESRKVLIKKKTVELWAKEFDLLALLAAQKNRVLSRDFLLQQIWGYDAGSSPSTKVVDVTISHLRQKLGSYGDKIVTVRGFGYRFDPS